MKWSGYIRAINAGWWLFWRYFTWLTKTTQTSFLKALNIELSQTCIALTVRWWGHEVRFQTKLLFQNDREENWNLTLEFMADDEWFLRQVNCSLFGDLVSLIDLWPISAPISVFTRAVLFSCDLHLFRSLRFSLLVFCCVRRFQKFHETAKAQLSRGSHPHPLRLSSVKAAKFRQKNLETKHKISGYFDLKIEIFCQSWHYFQTDSQKLSQRIDSSQVLYRRSAE